jgi:glycosyltransferase involved in cell wall biosynthesis
MKTFIVIPCWNDAKNITPVIESAKKYGQVVVIDDGSDDNSSEVAERAGAVVLKHFINRGQGASLETGNTYAYSQGADLVIHFDADGQHRSEEIPQLIAPILEGKVDVVMGSRFIGDNKQNVPWIKKWFILKPAIFFHNLLLGVNLTDAHNGFRAMNRKALSIIHLKQDRYSHASEIVAEIAKSGLKYQEVPVTIIYNRFGQGFKGGFEILLDLFFGKFRK